MFLALRHWREKRSKTSQVPSVDLAVTRARCEVALARDGTLLLQDGPDGHWFASHPGLLDNLQDNDETLGVTEDRAVWAPLMSNRVSLEGWMLRTLEMDANAKNSSSLSKDPQ